MHSRLLMLPLCSYASVKQGKLLSSLLVQSELTVVSEELTSLYCMFLKPFFVM